MEKVTGPPGEPIIRAMDVAGGSGSTGPGAAQGDARLLRDAMALITEMLQFIRGTPVSNGIAHGPKENDDQPQQQQQHKKRRLFRDRLAADASSLLETYQAFRAKQQEHIVATERDQGMPSDSSMAQAARQKLSGMSMNSISSISGGSSISSDDSSSSLANGVKVQHDIQRSNGSDHANTSTREPGLGAYENAMPLKPRPAHCPAITNNNSMGDALQAADDMVIYEVSEHDVLPSSSRSPVSLQRMDALSRSHDNMPPPPVFSPEDDVIRSINITRQQQEQQQQQQRQKEVVESEHGNDELYTDMSGGSCVTSGNHHADSVQVRSPSPSPRSPPATALQSPSKGASQRPPNSKRPPRLPNVSVRMTPSPAYELAGPAFFAKVAQASTATSPPPVGTVTGNPSSSTAHADPTTRRPLSMSGSTPALQSQGAAVVKASSLDESINTPKVRPRIQSQASYLIGRKSAPPSVTTSPAPPQPGPDATAAASVCSYHPSEPVCSYQPTEPSPVSARTSVSPQPARISPAPHNNLRDHSDHIMVTMATGVPSDNAQNAAGGVGYVLEVTPSSPAVPISPRGAGAGAGAGSPAVSRARLTRKQSSVKLQPASAFMTPDMKGAMEKRGGIGGQSWQARHVICDSGVLYFYKSPKDKRPTLRLRLRQYDVIEVPAAVESKRPTIHLQPRTDEKTKKKGKQYVLRARQNSEHVVWLSVLRTSSSGLKVGDSSEDWSTDEDLTGKEFPDPPDFPDGEYVTEMSCSLPEQSCLRAGNARLSPIADEQVNADSGAAEAAGTPLTPSSEQAMCRISVSNQRRATFPDLGDQIDLFLKPQTPTDTPTPFKSKSPLPTKKGPSGKPPVVAPYKPSSVRSQNTNNVGEEGGESKEAMATSSPMVVRDSGGRSGNAQRRDSGFPPSISGGSRPTSELSTSSGASNSTTTAMTTGVATSPPPPPTPTKTTTPAAASNRDSRHLQAELTHLIQRSRSGALLPAPAHTSSSPLPASPSPTIMRHVAPDPQAAEDSGNSEEPLYDDLSCAASQVERPKSRSPPPQRPPPQRPGYEQSSIDTDQAPGHSPVLSSCMQSTTDTWQDEGNEGHTDETQPQRQHIPPTGEIFTVIYNYHAQQHDEMSVHSGELLWIKDRSTHQEWWLAVRNLSESDDIGMADFSGEQGLVPSNYVSQTYEAF
ncbi:uncharacterized protein LOC135811357 isoform X1 [Sycon ciliatum]|uniref:uncharacterized protein LOC135811357 isoform X1 n=2 Tax=Sycon ciliatum TaxID=27933 RepID=UPI0031F71FEF